ncbi:antibiotic biosynthesis monooxygenase [Enterobacter bugandensis]|uniref:putative quinol monooxygenase n=1 Tax=Enterobacter bugandensis TaxID=881260 RepID=UPI002002A04B|nr:antibiotic biosynthesis monooxygenase [Enterobacter bugandensis]MCK6736091.1 antibiotic biosynthesis monooxygenase [Enterobacter bugandensis]HCM9227691.1 antibiotic biosynthesis monooxygenase [Enterobacter bugandensis]
MIKLTGFLMCKNEEEAALIRKYISKHKELTRMEIGCVSFDVMETSTPLIWKVEEVFTDQSAFSAHQARTKASVWGRETCAIKREYEISTIL